MLKLSIITIHYNQREALRSTLNSIRESGAKKNVYELIVVDGNSTDGSQSLFSEYEDVISKAVSEPDNGIFDAMNKGMKMASGEYIIYMNAGDQFCEGLLSDHFLENIKGDLVYGDYILSLNGVFEMKNQTPQLDFAFLISKTICHQSVFMRTDLCKQYPFRLDYPIIGDWIQLFSILRGENLTIQKLDIPICIYDGHGQSDLFKERRIEQRRSFLTTIYSEWELQTLFPLSRMRNRNWYTWVKEAPDKVRRGYVLDFLSRVI